MIAWIITSSVLIAVVLGLRFLFQGKISCRLQYAIWGLVLLKLLLPFSLFDSPFSIMHAVSDSSISDRQVYVLPISEQPVTETSGITVGNNATLTDTNSFGHAVLSEDGTTITRYVEILSVGQILTFIWLGGGIAVGLWFVGTNVQFYRRLRKMRQVYPASGSKLPVYVSDHIASPCLFGLLHPAVYLTHKAVDSEENTRYALAHELCHFRHGDHIWSILRCLCLATWWWNPLVWAAAIFSREDSELACDESVIKQIGQENRIAYGRTLVDMIALKKAPIGLMCAATTMASGKRGLKERLNMIIKSPKTVIPALAAVLLIVTLSAGCTFTGAGKNTQNNQEQEFPAVEMVFSSDSTGLEQLGRDAVAFYYEQFMKDDIPQYWHITKHEILSCELQAGDQAEFTVFATSYIETDGQGFLVGQGIPHDPDDLSKGGICPEVGRQFRIKAIDKGKYEIVSVGTGGGDQGLDPLKVSPSYALFQLKNGEVLGTISPLAGDDAKLAEDTVFNYMIKSAAWPGVDINTLSECYLLRTTYADDTTTDYYAYLLDGNAVMQMRADGLYSRINDELYERIVKLAQSGAATRESLGGPINMATSLDPTNLEDSVSKAIITANADGYQNADFAAQAHTLLKTVEKGNTTIVYAMALYMQFGYAGSGFSETGGSHMPVAITFEKNPAGEYELKEYWRPKDGSEYGPSIKDKFPAEIYADELDTQKYIVGHIQACYEQAIQYGQVNTDIEIAKMIEIITSSPAQMSNPQAYIEAHQAEYRKLIYYGDHTLRYSFNLFEQGSQTGLEGHIMASACQDILGITENPNLIFNTGQDWYDDYKKSNINL